MTISRWRNSKIYGLLGFILVAAPMLFFFFAGLPYARVSSTVISSSEYSVTETVWEGAFNPVFLYFVIGAAVAAWGCNRNKTLAWVGSLFVLFLSVLALFSVGLFALPGAVLLVTGAGLKTFNRST